MIFLPEGEKDVENIRKLGLAATCNPFGADEWNDGYAEVLRSAVVVVLPDNDATGHRRVVDKVLPSLYRVGVREVRVLELPGLAEKGDVSNWIDDGGTREQLPLLAAESPVLSPSTDRIELVIDVRELLVSNVSASLSTVLKDRNHLDTLALMVISDRPSYEGFLCELQELRVEYPGCGVSPSVGETIICLLIGDVCPFLLLSFH